MGDGWAWSRTEIFVDFQASALVVFGVKLVWLMQCFWKKATSQKEIIRKSFLHIGLLHCLPSPPAVSPVLAQLFPFHPRPPHCVLLTVCLNACSCRSPLWMWGPKRLWQTGWRSLKTRRISGKTKAKEQPTTPSSSPWPDAWPREVMFTQWGFAHKKLEVFKNKAFFLNATLCFC